MSNHKEIRFDLPIPTSILEKYRILKTIDWHLHSEHLKTEIDHDMHQSATQEDIYI